MQVVLQCYQRPIAWVLARLAATISCTENTGLGQSSIIQWAVRLLNCEVRHLLVKLGIIVLFE